MKVCIGTLIGSTLASVIDIVDLIAQGLFLNSRYAGGLGVFASIAAVYVVIALGSGSIAGASRAPGGGAAVRADRVLFDRRRIRVLTVLSTVGDRCGHCRCGATVRLTAEKWKPFTLPYVQEFLRDGLQSTLQITAVSGVLALPLGVVFALLRLSHRPAIRWIATSYIEIFIQVYMVISLIYIVIKPMVMWMETAPGGSLLR